MVLVQVEIYEVKLKVYIAKITNLTVLIELMEDDPDSYSELQIEEVKIKIKQVEALIVELQASIQITSTVLITIREQVTLSKSLINQHINVLTNVAMYLINIALFWVDEANLWLVQA